MCLQDCFYTNGKATFMLNIPVIHFTIGLNSFYILHSCKIVIVNVTEIIVSHS